VKKRAKRPGTRKTATGDRVVPIEELLDKRDDRNHVLHGDRNLEVIGNSLDEFGAFRSVAMDGDGIIRAGNGTVEAAAASETVKRARIIDAEPDELVVVRRPDLKGSRARAAGLADNRSADLHTYDDAAVSELLDEIAADGLDPAAFGMSDDEIDRLLAQTDGDAVGEPTAASGAEPVGMTPEQLEGNKRQNQNLDIYNHGKHTSFRFGEILTVIDAELYARLWEHVSKADEHNVAVEAVLTAGLDAIEGGKDAKAAKKKATPRRNRRRKHAGE